MYSTMGLSRRFLNLIVGNGVSGVKSLCSIDLTESLFNLPAPTEPPNGNGSQSGGPPDYANRQTPAADTGNEKNKHAQVVRMMEQFQLPGPSFNFKASASSQKDQSKIDCFPLAGRKVICSDQLGRAIYFDMEKGHAGTMPNLHNPKSMPLSLYVPNADADDDFGYHCLGSSLFVMERFPKFEAIGCTSQQQEYRHPHQKQRTDQFEYFVYRKPNSRNFFKAWHCQLPPPPPFVHEPKYWGDSRCRPEIISYAVLGPNDICISVNGVGTYSLHIENLGMSQAWKEVGKWTLPFRGRVEYVPELKLWFGFSGESQCLAAADLSSLELDSHPQLLGGPWKEELDLPEEWKECKDPQLVNLGSGKFCIARFFHHHKNLDVEELGDEKLTDQNFVTVLTGVEVAPRGVHDANVNANSSNEVTELQMITHKSRCHISSGTTIDVVF